MTGNETQKPGAAAIALAQPEPETRPLPGAGGPAGDWLCGWCNNPVANERERFVIDGRDEFSFSNPEGIRFDILTFSETHGCHQTGAPTLDDTWFPGHAWSFCLCDGCGQHLGWYYVGHQKFAGLISNRIVRALYLRN
ncbi:MAG TPA: cereblon family protein [Verrucomicrobiae bacterium]